MIWTADHDAKLSELYQTHEYCDIARILGTTTSAVRNRRYRLKLERKTERWTKAEEDILRHFYSAEYECDMGLNKLSEMLGGRIIKRPANISRKARELGLSNHNRLKHPNPHYKRKRMTREEQNRLTSERTKRLWAEGKHPKGMKGKNHTQETKDRLSISSKSFNDSLSLEKKAEYALKSAKTRERNGTLYLDRKASWGAAWRDIGGIRKYYRSKWEANYARYLQWLKERGEIQDWKHEPKTFWFEGILRGTRSYLPDFWVLENSGKEAYHEVKGWMDDASKTKIKRMKKYHPEIELIVIATKEYNAIKKTMKPLIPDWETDSKGR